jgi:hypothetical protein
MKYTRITAGKWYVGLAKSNMASKKKQNLVKKHKKKQVSPTSIENNNELILQDVVELGGDEVGMSYSTVFTMIHVKMTRL